VWGRAGVGRGVEGRAEEEGEEAENCNGPFHGIVPQLVQAPTFEGGIGDGGVIAAADFGDEAA
jgi:hypothetical protein